jgi:signal transduction histidine kinase
VSGSPALTHIGGKLEEPTVSGAALINASEATEIRGRTTSGSLELFGKLTRDARVDVEGVSGDLTLRLSAPGGLSAEIESFSGDIQGCLAKGVERVDRSCARLEQLVDRLLDVSRVTVGRMSLEVDDVDLASVAREVIERVRDEAERAGCTIDLEAPEPVIGRWDRFRVEQVVTNLVSNAIKYGQGRPVVVAVLKRGDRALLSVEDHGIGIEPADQQRLFKRFERAVSENSFGGFGMGLWIVRQIVEAHGGVIRVKSRRGEGSTFVVEIPLYGVGHDRGADRAPVVASVGAGR